MRLKRGEREPEESEIGMEGEVERVSGRARGPAMHQVCQMGVRVQRQMVLSTYFLGYFFLDTTFSILPRYKLQSFYIKLQDTHKNTSYRIVLHFSHFSPYPYLTSPLCLVLPLCLCKSRVAYTWAPLFDMPRRGSAGDSCV